MCIRFTSSFPVTYHDARSRDVYVTPRRWGGAGLLGAVAPRPHRHDPWIDKINSSYMIYP